MAAEDYQYIIDDIKEKLEGVAKSVIGSLEDAKKDLETAEKKIKETKQQVEGNIPTSKLLDILLTQITSFADFLNEKEVSSEIKEGYNSILVKIKEQLGFLGIGLMIWNVGKELSIEEINNVIDSNKSYLQKNRQGKYVLANATYGYVIKDEKITKKPIVYCEDIGSTISNDKIVQQKDTKNMTLSNNEKEIPNLSIKSVLLERESRNIFEKDPILQELYTKGNSITKGNFYVPKEGQWLTIYISYDKEKRTKSYCAKKEEVLQWEIVKTSEEKVFFIVNDSTGKIIDSLCAELG
ncbi:MAG: hypothetical protein IJD50_05550 [Clostridia bacterium]|nr:hypothetical protein [Clostridia bacterium]